jgi:hypothetical protein
MPWAPNNDERTYISLNVTTENPHGVLNSGPLIKGRCCNHETNCATSKFLFGSLLHKIIETRRPLIRSQRPRGLRHEMSSSAWTLGSWVRIPLEAWMFACVYSVSVLSRVGRGLATGWSPVQGVLPTVYKRLGKLIRGGKGRTWVGAPYKKKKRRLLTK